MLIVEDDRTLRQTLASAVERAGYRVTAVGDGLAGAREVGEGAYDVVLLDLGAPAGGGHRGQAGVPLRAGGLSSTPGCA